jgi:hypothetical protein
MSIADGNPVFPSVASLSSEVSRKDMNPENSEPFHPHGKEGIKKGSGIPASVGAILSSLATMGCCLPLGFAGALGAAGASAFVEKFRPWLLALSIVLLGIGFWQQRRARLCSVKRNYLSAVLLWTGVVLVVAMIVFPQEIAGLIADHLSGAAK